MVDWILDGLIDALLTLFGTAIVESGFYTWNTFIELASGTFSTPPSAFAEGTVWQAVQYALISLKLIGASLFSIFFYMNLFKKTVDLKHGWTMEVVIEAFIKLLVGNLVFVNLDTIIDTGIAIGQDLLGYIVPGGEAALTFDVEIIEEWDADSAGVGILVGLLFFLVCLIGGLAINLYVYGLFFKLYYVVMTAPLALSAIAGPEEVFRTAEGWIKTFIATVFEFFGVQFMLWLCAVFVNSGSYFIDCPVPFLESAWNMLQVMLAILITLSSAFGVHEMTRRTFNL